MSKEFSFSNLSQAELTEQEIRDNHINTIEDTNERKAVYAQALAAKRKLILNQGKPLSVKSNLVKGVEQFEEEKGITLLNSSGISIMKFDANDTPVKVFEFKTDKQQMFKKNLDDLTIAKVKSIIEKAEVQKIIVSIMGNRVGGKGKQHRKQKETELSQYFAGVQLYGNNSKITYKGLMKYVPHYFMALRAANFPLSVNGKVINNYAPGIELQFPYEDLKQLGLSDVELKYCYTLLLRNINQLGNNTTLDDLMKKSIRRYTSYEKAYPFNDIRNNTEVQLVLNKMLSLDLGLNNNLDLSKLV